METVQFQSYVFLYLVYGGILAGILYDIYRAFNRRKRGERLVASLWDVLFLLSVFFVMLWAIFSSNYGDIRAYVFIGFLVGFYLYEMLLGKIVSALIRHSYKSIVSFIRKAGSFFAFPAKFLYSYICQCCHCAAHAMKYGNRRLRKAAGLPKQVIGYFKKSKG